MKLNEASFLDSEVAVKMFCGGTKGEISITDILAPYTIMWILSGPIDILSIVYQVIYLIAKKNNDNNKRPQGEGEMVVIQKVRNC